MQSSPIFLGNCRGHAVFEHFAPLLLHLGEHLGPVENHLDLRTAEVVFAPVRETLQGLRERLRRPAEGRERFGQAKVRFPKAAEGGPKPSGRRGSEPSEESGSSQARRCISKMKPRTATRRRKGTMSNVAAEVQEYLATAGKQSSPYTSVRIKPETLDALKARSRVVAALIGDICSSA
jgi:hypothetical protein